MNFRQSLLIAATVFAGSFCRGSDLVWSIGQPDNSADEFASGSAESLVYDVGRASAKNWRARQSVGDEYLIHFQLSDPLAAEYRLIVHGFFLEAGPTELHLTVNGRKGQFQLEPKPGKDSDFRQGGNFIYSIVRLAAPIGGNLLRAGANTIALTLGGLDGETLNYDYLALEPVSVSSPDEAVRVEPTIFYRNTPGGLCEVTRVIISHRLPLRAASIALSIGDAAPLVAQVADDGADFGETALSLNVPAEYVSGPCKVRLKAEGSERSFACDFRPEKKWKLYAGLKVHNDVGYTNLQKNIQALHERNVDVIVDELRKHPAHRFNLENSWLAETYLESRNPPRREELMELAHEGRLGISALYLNLLTGLCSSEELCRAVYYSASLQREHGVPIRFASLTDTPSQSWGLASVLADAGITGFALGSNQHRGPLLINSDLNETSPFYWEGADGQKVLTFIARAYHQVGRLYERNSIPLMARNVSEALARYQRPDYPFDALYLLGWLGDNNDVRDAGVSTIERWNAAYAFPKLIAATDAEYFDYIAGNFAAQIPTRRGDMGSYWADAAGTATHATIENRDAQRTMPVAEMAASWASLLAPEIAYPAADFHDGWKAMLMYDEHSWGANNSMTQPGERFGAEQEDFKEAQAERARRIAHDILNLSLARMIEHASGDGPAIMALNPSAHSQTTQLEAEIDANQQIFDLRTNKPVLMDVVAKHEPQDVSKGLPNWYSGLVRPWRTVRFLAEDIPGFGYRSYEIRRTQKGASGNQARSGSWEMDGKYYHVALDPRTGAIRSIFDVELGRELIDQKAPHGANELVYAAGGEGQTIINNLHGWPATRLDVSGQLEARLLEHVRTPFGERIRIEAHAKNVPVIDSEITLYDRLKRIDIVDHIRKDDIRKKEAIYFAFPFGVTPPQLQYQVQNGWVRPDQDLLPGACQDYFTTQNLVLASDAGATIAFATPDLPLVTLTDINRGRWATRFETTNGHVYSYVTNNYWDTNVQASQFGDLEFHYFITSQSTLDYDRLADFDAATRQPVIAYRVHRWFKTAKAEAPLKEASGSLISVDAPDVRICAFKRAEDGDGYIIRLLETSGRTGTARVSSKVFTVASADLTNGIEVNQTALPVKAGGIDIPLAPHHYSTVRLRFAGLGGKDTP